MLIKKVCADEYLSQTQVFQCSEDFIVDRERLNDDERSSQSTEAPVLQKGS